MAIEVEGTLEKGLNELAAKVANDHSIPDQPRDLKPVRLTNGSEEEVPLIKMTVFILKSLIERDPAAVFELVALCRDRTHSPWGDTGARLKELKLISESEGRWHVHDSIRNVVLSACKGEGMDMVLVDPVADKPAEGKEQCPHDR